MLRMRFHFLLMHGCKQAVGMQQEWKLTEKRDFGAIEHAGRLVESNGADSAAAGT